MPQLRIRKELFLYHLRHILRRDGKRALHPARLFPFIQKDGFQPAVCLHKRSILHLRLRHDTRPSCGHLRRRHPRTVPCHVHVLLHDEAHIPVNTAIEDMFASSGRDSRIPQVVHAHENQIGAGPYKGSNIYQKCRITAPVRARKFSVHIDFRVLKACLELQIQLLRIKTSLYLQPFAVASIAYIKLLFHEIRNPKRMRNPDIIPFPIIIFRRFRLRKITMHEFPVCVN